MKLLVMSYHFKESWNPMMSIYVLMEATCCYGLLRTSNLANEGNLKFSKMGASYISSERGWGSSSPSRMWRIFITLSIGHGGRYPIEFSFGGI